jgi:phosphoserine phosphatase RsbU/P
LPPSPDGAVASRQYAATIAKYRDRVEGLAKAWLDMGAAGFGIWSEGSCLVSWRSPDVPGSRYIAAPIDHSSDPAAELRVEIDPSPALERRLAADASLVSALIAAEIDADTVTAELVETQDQLVAVYDMVRAFAGIIDIPSVLKLISAKSCELIGASAAFAICQPSETRTELAQCPPGFTVEDELLGLFSLLQASGNAMVLGPETPTVLSKGADHVALLPISVNGRVMAGLGLINSRRGPFSAPQLKLAESISRQAAAKLESILLYQETLRQTRVMAEMDLARRIQSSWFDRVPPPVDGLDLYGACKPALNTGGDFYDFLRAPDGSFHFALGDVSGKGLSSAMVMSMARVLTRNAASRRSGATPVDVVNHLSSDLYGELTDLGMFVTVFVGQYHADTRSVSYVNAGQSPVLYRPAGGEVRLIQADCIPVGVLPAVDPVQRSLRLAPGDLLIVASDGFNEAHDESEEMFGIDRLASMASALSHLSAPEIARAMLVAVEDFSRGHPQDDDQTIVVLKGV